MVHSDKQNKSNRTSYIVRFQTKIGWAGQIKRTHLWSGPATHTNKESFLKPVCLYVVNIFQRPINMLSGPTWTKFLSLYRHKSGAKKIFLCMRWETLKIHVYNTTSSKKLLQSVEMWSDIWGIKRMLIIQNSNV